MTRVRPGTTVLGGVAIGLTAGAALFSALSPSVVATSPMAFRVPKAPAALTRVTPAPINPAPCATGSTLVKGVCVVKVVRTVVVPAPVAAAAPVSEQSAPGTSAGSGNSAPTGNNATAGHRAPARTGTSSGPYRAPSSEQEDEHESDEQAGEDTDDNEGHDGDHSDGATHADD